MFRASHSLSGRYIHTMLCMLFTSPIFSEFLAGSESLRAKFSGFLGQCLNPSELSSHGSQPMRELFSTMFSRFPADARTLLSDVLTVPGRCLNPSEQSSQYSWPLPDASVGFLQDEDIIGS